MRTLYLAARSLPLFNTAEVATLHMFYSEPKDYNVSFGKLRHFQGKAIQRREDGSKRVEDGFAGVRPEFNVDLAERRVTYSWGNTHFAGATQPQRTYTAKVVFNAADHIAAAKLRGQTLHTINLYPALGFMTATVQYAEALFGLMAGTQIHAATCITQSRFNGVLKPDKRVCETRV